MNRERFMTELHQALEGRLPDGEILEILEDYREFFDVGLSQGNTEEEVAQKLGDPAKIALSLLSKEETVSAPTAPQAFAKAETYRRVSAFITDTLMAALPFLWFSPRFALTSFFFPQQLALITPSLLSTIRVSSHSFIAVARPFWAAAVIGATLWFLFLTSACLVLFQGRTLGKMVFGLRVVDRTGQRARPGRLVVREVAGKLGLNMLFGSIWYPLAFVPTVASLIWNIVSKEGMTVWDAIAGTRVINADATKGRGENWTRS